MFFSKLAPQLKRFSPSEHFSDDGEASGSAKIQPTIRTLIIMNDPRSLAGGLNFLEKRGYKHVIAKNIREAKLQISEFRPHVVLLSWNLKSADVKKIYSLLINKFKLICVVFAEDSTARTTASLMSSGIPHSLLAPVSGPSIHMRVQALLRPKIESPQSRKRAASSVNKVSIKASEIPQGTAWEACGRDENNGSLWKGITHDSAAANNVDQKKDVFYFSGEHPPRFDEQAQCWKSADPQTGENFFREQDLKAALHEALQEGLKVQEFNTLEEGTNSDALYAIQKGVITEELSATHEAPEFDWDDALKSSEKEFDALALSAELESARVEPDHGQPISTQSSDYFLEKQAEDEAATTYTKKAKPAAVTTNAPTVSTRPESVLMRAIRASAKEAIKASPEIVTPIGLVQSAVIIPISTRQFRGYLMAVRASNHGNQELMRVLMPELKRQLSELNQELTIDPPLWPVTFSPLHFLEWAKKSSEFSISLATDLDTVGFAFVSCNEFPQTINVADESVLGVSLEKDLKGDTPLTFDLYLHLPKNDKFLLYLNRGANLSASTIDKFGKFGITEVYIRKNERDLFLAYCARNFILSKKAG